MHVEKPVDLALLGTELARAGVATQGLGYHPTDEAGGGEVYTYDATGRPVDLPPEAEPVLASHDAGKPARATTFEAQEDAERQALVAERAQTDPAFAALAELALRKEGV